VAEPEHPRVPVAIPAKLVTGTRVGMRRFRGLEGVAVHDRTTGGPPREPLDPLEPVPDRIRAGETRQHAGRTGSSRQPALLAAAAALLVALAIAKPWTGRVHGSTAAAGTPATSPAASPARAYPSAGDGAIAWRPAGGGITGSVGIGAPWDGAAGQWSGGAHWGPMTLGGTADPLSCMTPAGWRLVVDELDDPGSTAPSPRVSSRSWLPAVPVPAASPSDPGVPFVQVASREITALGVCAAKPALRGRAVTIWRLVPSNPAAGPSPRAIIVARLPVPADADGVISLPVLGGDGCRSNPVADGCLHLPAWPPGRYVLQIGNTGTGATEGWMGLEVVRPAP
jgi:hypothetical protein